MTIRKQIVQIIIHLWMNDSRIHRNRGTLLFLPQSLGFTYPNWRKRNGNDFFLPSLFRQNFLLSFIVISAWIPCITALINSVALAGFSPVFRRLFAGCSRFLTGLLRISELIFKVSDKCLGRSNAR